VSPVFVGPLPLVPSRFDNYGADYGQSKFVCLSCCSSDDCPLVLVSNARDEINEFVVLNPSVGHFCLFNIGKILMPSVGKARPLFALDPLEPSRYYVADGSSNVYSMELVPASALLNDGSPMAPVKVEQLIDGKVIRETIEQLGLIETRSRGPLAILTGKAADGRKVCEPFVDVFDNVHRPFFN
jgi:hypothetical protein